MNRSLGLDDQLDIPTLTFHVERGDRRREIGHVEVTHELVGKLGVREHGHQLGAFLLQVNHGAGIAQGHYNAPLPGSPAAEIDVFNGVLSRRDGRWLGPVARAGGAVGLADPLLARAPAPDTVSTALLSTNWIL